MGLRMPPTEVVLFRELDGRVPLMEWLDQLPSKARKKCFAFIEILETEGHEVRRPVADYLRDGIYELRPTFGGQQHRILYFFSGNRAIVLSHGIRKEKAVPQGEIDRALARRTQFLKAPERHSVPNPRE
jgi:hypothetical protein